MSRCGACSLDLPAGVPAGAFHPTCSRRLFGQAQPPALPYAAEDLQALVGLLGHPPPAAGPATGSPGFALALRRPDPRHPTGQLLLALTPGLPRGQGSARTYCLRLAPPAQPHGAEAATLALRLAARAGVATAPHALLGLRDQRWGLLTRQPPPVRGPLPPPPAFPPPGTGPGGAGTYEAVAAALAAHAAHPGLGHLLRAGARVPAAGQPGVGRGPAPLAAPARPGRRPGPAGRRGRPGPARPAVGAGVGPERANEPAHAGRCGGGLPAGRRPGAGGHEPVGPLRPAAPGLAGARGAQLFAPGPPAGLPGPADPPRGPVARDVTRRDARPPAVGSARMGPFGTTPGLLKGPGLGSERLVQKRTNEKLSEPTS